MADLAEIATEDLMKEVQRRLNCQSKPEKRLILVGKGNTQTKRNNYESERTNTRYEEDIYELALLK